MQTPSVACALVSAMVAKHRWGTPIGREHLLAIAPAASNDYPEAREVFEDLRNAPYITNRGKRGIELNNSEFETLADFLYHTCE